MNTRYQAYNELTFEAYCKTSIDHAILKGRMEQAKRAALEVPLRQGDGSFVLANPEKGDEIPPNSEMSK